MLPEKKYEFEPDWKSVFIRDFCKICKHRLFCPDRFECKDMIDFVELNEEAHESNLHDDDSENSA